MGQARRLFAVVFLLVFAQGTGIAHAASTVDSINSAQSEETIRDADDDGDPDLVKLRRDFAGDGRPDTMLIVDTEDSLQRLDNWRHATEYDGIRVIYDAGSDGTAEVVVDFKRRQGRWSHVAHVYDSETRDLGYEVRGASVSLPELEASEPALVVKSASPWIHQGQVSYDLQIVCPPGARCSFDEPTYNRTKNVTISVADRNDDGEPEYEVRQVDTRFSPRASIMRTQLMVSTESERTLNQDDGVLWPYLGTSGRDYTRRYRSMYPPIQVNWEVGRIVGVSEFVASRGEEDNYFIYSFREFDPHEVNPPSFEYPFSFYDLANDDDEVPELQIRMVAEAQGSYFGLGLSPQTLPFPFTQSRYSWDQNNDGEWDYKIDVTGTNSYSEVTRVGPYRLRKPSYGVLPDWVLSHRWQGAQFVHAVNGFRSSEGIYAGGYDRETRRKILGLEAKSGPLFANSPSGYRLEVSGAYNARPRIYHSPVDKGLHLYGLDYGFWNRTGDRSTVRYDNVDSDPFVDMWRIRGEEQSETLVAENETLVYADSEAISFKRTAINQSTFVTQPPKTTREWSQLRSRLNRSGAVTANLGSRFSRYDGETFAVTDATFTDYVPTDDGFRIYATLSSESRMRNTSLTLPDTNQVVFVFHDDQGTVDVHRATPPSLSLKNASADAESITPLEQNMINIAVRNDGWQTARNVTVALTDDDGTIANRTVSVVGKQTRTVKLQWWPTSDYTESTIEVRFDGETVATQPLVGTLEHREAPSLLVRYGIGNWSTPLTLGTGLAVSLGLLVIARRILG